MSLIEQKARDLSRPILETIGQALARWNISPNGVTYLGLVLTIGAALLAAWGEFRWGGVVYIVAALCDALDGALARASGKGSRFGAFLDSTLDRLEESVVFLGLIVYYARAGSPIEPPLILLVTVGSLMVSYTRARAEAVGVTCREGLMTRPFRVVLMILGLILNQVLIALIVLAITSLFTTMQRMVHVWQMTGGEKGGWGPVKEPFAPPTPPVQPTWESNDPKELP
ncbi:MAG: CDP-alcohol phosphatidyltransferase family protein [Anaerolineae bacterium]